MYAITAIHTGENGAIFLPYTLIFLTLQRWQTFFNCANFLQIFFDFFVKMPFGWVCRRDGRGITIGAGWVAAVGGVFSLFARCSIHRRRGRFLLLRSWLPLGFGGNPRPNVARLIVKVAAGGGCGSDGGGTAHFWAHFWAFFRRVWNCPPFRRLPSKRRVFGVFGGVFLYCCKYLYKKIQA